MNRNWNILQINVEFHRLCQTKLIIAFRQKPPRDYWRSYSQAMKNVLEKSA